MRKEDKAFSWVDILDEHARALARGDTETITRLRALVAGQPDLLTLMDVAERVARLYVPVRPRAAFRERLKATLMAQETGTPARRRIPRPGRRVWLLGAMASVLSLAGGLGVYLWARRSHAA